MTYATPEALRAGLDARLLLLAQERATDPNRLRRHLTFQRIVRRLAADGGWVLKGGYLLEARLGADARATRDLDLGAERAMAPAEIRDEVERALARDVDGDGFDFVITGARQHLRDEEAGGPGVHLSVSALLAGRAFATVRMDVVSRPSELLGGVEDVELPQVVTVPGWPPVVVPAVDLAQHAAEKLHALSALDSHPRLSTRVKDLVDLVLLADAGAVDEDRLRERVAVVFLARDGSPPHRGLPRPPAAWRAGYAVFAATLDLPIRALEDAFAQVSALFDRVRPAVPTEEPAP